MAQEPTLEYAVTWEAELAGGEPGRVRRTTTQPFTSLDHIREWLSKFSPAARKSFKIIQVDVREVTPWYRSGVMTHAARQFVKEIRP